MSDLEKPKRSTRKKQVVGKVKTYLYFRSEPAVARNVISILKKGELVHVIEDLGEWLKVEHENKEGYVMSQYIKKGE